MTSLDRLEPSVLAAGPGDRGIVASIQSGNVFTCLLADDPGLCAAKLEAVLDSIADLDTRIARVGNPLRSPLTIERILIQVAGPKADSRIDRDPALLAAVLASPMDDETRLLVVVEQPQTIDPETMQILHAMRPHLQEMQPRVQFLFAGPSAFAEMLPPDGRSPDATTEAGEPVSGPAPRPRLRMAPVVLIAAVLVLAVLIGAVYRPHPSPMAVPVSATAAARATPVQPAEAPVQTNQAKTADPPAAAQVAPEQAPPAVQAVPAAPPIPESAPERAAPASMAAPAGAELDSEARLRREFDLFLARSGQNAARLPEAQRAALLEEFRAWRRSKGSADHEDLAQPSAEHADKVR